MHRRCISTRIVCTDQFLTLAPAAQAMYLQMIMSADDDGIVDRPMQVAKLYVRGIKLLDDLEKNGYIIRIDGICVITHWRVSNTIRADRTKALAYPDYASRIWIDAANAYTLDPSSGIKTLLDTRSKATATWIDDQAYDKLFRAYPPDHVGDMSASYAAYRQNIQSADDAEQAMEQLAICKQSQAWQGGQIPTLAKWLASGAWHPKSD